MSAHDDELDGIAVEREIHGAAHAHVGKRVFTLDVRAAQLFRTLIEHEENGAIFRARYKLDA